MPSLGVLVGLPIAVILFFAFIAVGVWFRVHKWDRYDVPAAKIASRVLTYVAPALVAIVTAITMFPYSGEYHEWKITRGTVAAVSSRIIPTGDHSMEQRFAVTFTDGRMRACDDTRCTQIKAGGTLTLKCKRHWQWAATPGYDCNFVDYRS